MDDMDNALYEALSAALHTEYEPNIIIFNQTLNECGYMIVPIEDPTNWRFGRDE